MSNLTRDKGSSNSLTCDIWDRNGFGPTGEVVNAGERICVSSGGRGPTKSMRMWSKRMSGLG